MSSVTCDQMTQYRCDFRHSIACTTSPSLPGSKHLLKLDRSCCSDVLTTNFLVVQLTRIFPFSTLEPTPRTMSSNTAKPSSLLAIPPELRLDIFEYFFEIQELQVTYRSTGFRINKTHAVPKHLNLLRINHLLRREALSVFHNKTTLKVIVARRLPPPYALSRPIVDPGLLVGMTKVVLHIGSSTTGEQTLRTLGMLRKFDFCANVKELHLDFHNSGDCCDESKAYENSVVLEYMALKCPGRITMRRVQDPMT